jgi:uncharacterized RDD family membrane protein YckC
MTTVPAGDTKTLAGHGRRLAAALLDAVAYTVVVSAFGVVGFVVGLAIGTSTGDDTWSDGWEALGWILVCSILGLMIGFVFWVVLTVWLVRRPGARNGQTLGKQMVGIRAARADGTPIVVGLALLREIVTKWLLIAVVSTLISALLGFLDGGSIGSLVAVAIWYGPAFGDDQRRALHDRMCNTRVVVAGPPPAAVASSDDDLWPAVSDPYTQGATPQPPYVG